MECDPSIVSEMPEARLRKVLAAQPIAPGVRAQATCLWSKYAQKFPTSLGVSIPSLKLTILRTVGSRGCAPTVSEE